MTIIQELYTHLEEARLWEPEQRIGRHEFLIQAGRRERYVYYELEGSLRAYVVHGAEEQVVRLAYTNNFITALDSFITDQPTAFYIQALKKTKVKRIAKPIYRDFLHSRPELMSLWNRLLEADLLQQIEREQDLLIDAPIERYRRVLKRSPQLFQHIPHKHIAAYLRMTPETLSRIKKS